MKLLYVFIACGLLNITVTGQPVKVMLITGGHSYDTLQFLNMFEAMDDIEFRQFIQPEANKAIADGKADEFDLLVFYDMWKDVNTPEKEAYIKLTRQGKPFLFLHHALVSYQNWPEFEKLIGGRYVENPELEKEQQSTYRHDVWIDVEIVDQNHPVTYGLSDFKIFDEVYGNYIVMPGVKPLLRTNHPESTSIIGWENKYNASAVVYLQPGHDKHAYESDDYRRLLRQALMYLGGRGK